jgi:hypothetical protein
MDSLNKVSADSNVNHIQSFIGTNAFLHHSSSCFSVDSEIVYYHIYCKLILMIISYLTTSAFFKIF